MKLKIRLSILVITAISVITLDLRYGCHQNREDEMTNTDAVLLLMEWFNKGPELSQAFSDVSEYAGVILSYLEKIKGQKEYTDLLSQEETSVLNRNIAVLTKLKDDSIIVKDKIDLSLINAEKKFIV
jgi:hypothetical protein